MPERPEFQKTRQYMFTPQQIRLAVALGTVGMIVVIVGLLFLASSRPQGRFEVLDDTQFQQHLADATGDLSGYTVDGDRATIDINRAIELVAERGVQNPGFAGAAPVAPAAPAVTAPPAAEPAAEPAAATEPAEEPAAAEATAEAEPAAPVEAAAEPAAEPAPAAAAVDEDLPDGEAAFLATCMACHQATGQGVMGAFPPLAGHAPEVYAADRNLIPTTILFGLQGAITVDGMPYNGIMTPHLHLDDATVASISNYVMTAWGNDALAPDFQPFSSAEVEALRGQMLTMTEVHDLRTAAGLD
ncbi:MAG: cytochrome c [Trueperaceae bacterium]|jgi:mono/diheme cytochrome c family protein